MASILFVAMNISYLANKVASKTRLPFHSLRYKWGGYSFVNQSFRQRACSALMFLVIMNNAHRLIMKTICMLRELAAGDCPLS